jgi:hypothetical protein
MFADEPLRNRIALYGILTVLFLISIFGAFSMGIDYQKEHGPHGNECPDETYRQPGGFGEPRAAVCKNGYWFEIPIETFPRDKLEKKP